MRSIAESCHELFKGFSFLTLKPLVCHFLYLWDPEVWIHHCIPWRWVERADLRANSCIPNQAPKHGRAVAPACWTWSGGCTLCMAKLHLSQHPPLPLLLPCPAPSVRQELIDSVRCARTLCGIICSHLHLRRHRHKLAVSERRQSCGSGGCQSSRLF